MNDPISNIVWRPADDLHANTWNPNVVFSPELKLLARSILQNGWIQPIIVNPDGMIIDGFHRASLARQHPKIREKYKGLCPTVVMPLDTAHAMALTVRINRAKGSHIAVRMSELVKALIDEHNMDPAEVAEEIGATKDEVDLLYQDGVFKAKKIAEHQYSKAWVPADTRQVSA